MSETEAQTEAQTTSGPPLTRYTFLIHEAEEIWSAGDAAAFEESLAAHGRFAQAVFASGGAVVAGEALRPTTAATTVRGDLVTDGPFAETKESLGGFYVVDARDLDHALELAKLCPMGTGCVEVRPVIPTGPRP